MSFKPTYLYSRLVETLPPLPVSLPWQSGDPNVKGDPRKSVKWIDVRAVPVSTLTIGMIIDFGLYITGSPWYRILPRRPHPSRPRLGL